MRNKLTVAIFTLFFCSLSFAGYQAIGPIKAEDCYNFGVKVCSIKTVTEVRKDGKRYEITNYFERVSKYQSSNSMCYINTKSEGLGIFSYGINAITQPEFWGTNKEGKYGRIDADYIFFKCIER